MGTLYRPKHARDMTPQQHTLKLTMDANWKKASDEAAKPFYDKKHSIGVSKEEEAAFKAADNAAWDSEVAARITAGLYEGYDEATYLQEERSHRVAEIAVIDAKLAVLGG